MRLNNYCHIIVLTGRKMALRFLHSEVLLRPIGVVQRLLSSERHLSSAAEPAVAADVAEASESSQPSIQNLTKKLAPFRVTESDPTKHTINHLGRYYTLPQATVGKLFKYGGITKKYEEMAHTFTETCIMVRKPYLELIQHLEKIDFSKPAVRFVLYSKPGCGKSLTISHIVHYGHNAGYLLVHVPWANKFMRRCKEVSPSETKPGMLDVPIDGSSWLVHFKTQNLELLDKLKFTTTKDYEWGPRESTPAGSSLLELIEFGVARAKYACDVVEVLLKEIKMYSNQGRCKTMVVIDGFNALLAPFVITERRKQHEGQCTLALPFIDMCHFDWCNGVVITTVDRIAHSDMFNATSDLPHYLLGEKGWAILDPFIPIEVEKYTEDEMNSALDYYIDRRWIQNPSGCTPEGRAELAALSTYNPYTLMRLSAPL